MDRAPALCIVGDLGVIRNAFSASLSRHKRAWGRSMAMSSKPTYGQLHVSLAENHPSIQCPPSHNFRIARHPPGIGSLLIACYRSGGFLAATLASNGGPDECHGVGSAQA